MPQAPSFTLLRVYLVSQGVCQNYGDSLQFYRSYIVCLISVMPVSPNFSSSFFQMLPPHYYFILSTTFAFLICFHVPIVQVDM
ncbi:hypothetical protein QL285_043748 [Trifolium repens]|nr:hypothetical protein QL285_043748 [Trifolium repens]